MYLTFSVSYFNYLIIFPMLKNPEQLQSVGGNKTFEKRF